MTQYRLCVDPGVRGCGCGFFYGSALLRAEYVTVPDLPKKSGPRSWAVLAARVFDWSRALLPAPGVQIDVILERPIIYPDSAKQKGDPNDIVDLAGVVGAIAGEHSDDLISHYYPSDWKGQVKKAVMTKRILAALTAWERSRIARVGSKDHNTIDAVGIGLFAAGRLHKKVIYR